jgi:uncharacterized protein (TIGR01319 family)
MGVVALADFGSTYTKVALVEPGEGRLVARAEAPTTIGSDLMEGYSAALTRAVSAASAAGERIQIEEQLAASSAGGGLRVAAIGLVAELTATAARQTALNAGARVECVLTGVLDAEQLARLDEAGPEIILFAGGTDGGQADLVLENARRLAPHIGGRAVVVACNTGIAADVSRLLAAGGVAVEIAGNVMPSLGVISPESARKAILGFFLGHVIGGKGLSADPEFKRMVKLPTPEAVFEATRLFASGGSEESGVGEVMVIDVGGATTDVHSHHSLERLSPGIEGPLLASPATLRTVEGDLGLRSGAQGAFAADRKWIASGLGIEEASIRHAVSVRADRPEWIPDTAEEADLDRLLALTCAAQALRRHCGTMLLSRGDGGPPSLRREGADLREVGLVLGTGGVFAHRGDAEEILRKAVERRAAHSLAPENPRLAVDSNYVMAAAGVLASVDPAAGWRLLQRSLLASED